MLKIAGSLQLAADIQLWPGARYRVWAHPILFCEPIGDLCDRPLEIGPRALRRDPCDLAMKGDHQSIQWSVISKAALPRHHHRLARYHCAARLDLDA